MFDVAEFENGWGREGWNKQVAPAFFLYLILHVTFTVKTKDE